MTSLPSIVNADPALSFSDLVRSAWKIFTLHPREASLAVRGFSWTNPAKCARLEECGGAFITGYNAAITAKGAAALRCVVDALERELRGFAAEGAAMGTAIRAAVSFSSPQLRALRRLFEGDFDYLTHVGIGWAMARAPWGTGALRKGLDPIHHWLTYDGQGFHDTYFHHRRVLSGWRQQREGYAARSYDQGVGRCLWFVSGGDVAQATGLIATFAEHRRGDLWSGLGLAMTYAGATDSDDVAAAFAAAASHRAHFAQGIAFACEARAKAGLVPAHTDMAARSVWGVDAHALAHLVRAARRSLPQAEGATPRYQLWRQSIAAALSLPTEG